MAKNTAKGGGWVTINGVHVLIENGKITKGPAKFIGSSVDNLPSSSTKRTNTPYGSKSSYSIQRKRVENRLISGGMSSEEAKSVSTSVTKQVSKQSGKKFNNPNSSLTERVKGAHYLDRVTHSDNVNGVNATNGKFPYKSSDVKRARNGYSESIKDLSAKISEARTEVRKSSSNSNSSPQATFNNTVSGIVDSNRPAPRADETMGEYYKRVGTSNLGQTKTRRGSAK